MNLQKRIVLILCLIFLFNESSAQQDAVASAQHKLLGMEQSANDHRTSPHNPHPGAAWFPKAGLGLFIHWGAIAGYGGGDISWCMLADRPWLDDGTVTPAFYYRLMDSWNPKKYDPDKLVREAKAAGFQYAVLTTKHHDGYTLWPSKYGDLGTQTKMGGKDFVKPFVEACRKYGLKVGFYYSPPDWWFDRQYKNWSYSDKHMLDMDHKERAGLPTMPKDHNQKRKEMVAAQVRELLSQYGKIDLLWFDGGAGEISNEEVRQLQPGIIINRRNGGRGDYGDSEGSLPEKRFSGWFETCDPVWPTRWWSYSTSDSYDNAATVLANLIKLRAWGGNLLANIGPMGDGTIPAPATEAMAEMAQWMKHSQESILDTEGGNYPEKSNVPVTVKGNAIYAFAMPGYQGEMNVVSNGIPRSVTLLRTGEKVSFEKDGNTLKIKIAAKSRTRLPDVVKITM
ncbi:alpha-L-fucosidase [Sphingobacterium spiritivorum]|uniref:alpha-L-fucosidase n=1 Tax=Sphingobacterium spiritivorum TaxID=258 RepID=UPI003DA1D3EE